MGFLECGLFGCGVLSIVGSLVGALIILMLIGGLMEFIVDKVNSWKKH